MLEFKTVIIRKDLKDFDVNKKKGICCLLKQRVKSASISSNHKCPFLSITQATY